MIKKVSEIRNAFLNYFRSLDHEVVPSSSLLPVGDPTLLFTTAGMVQFKPLYTGAVELPYPKATSCQKCLRTTDLEQVGKTERHCTFFEMLGNFSFGDYFKKEAILYAYEFSIQHLGFKKEDIWISVYEDDDESIDIWIRTGIPANRIVKLGKKDNFWGPAGDTGACGPCSELYLDRGVGRGFADCSSKSSCKPGCECDRFLEFWNLVFNQYDQDSLGNLNPLKQTGIDTGMGLERVAMLLQGADSVYDTDELKKIIAFIENISGKVYTKDNAPSFRVLTDHSRSVTFSISDGIIPDKTGRGYVIRRLIRRASLFARKLDIKEPFLYKIVEEIVAIYGEVYPEISKKKDQIKNIIFSEEELFLNTLEFGLEQLEYKINEYMESDKKVFSGKDSFRLYSTFGFPPEMTAELLEEKGISFDKEGFLAELEKDRDMSRETWKGKKVSYLSLIDKSNLKATRFVGYDNTKFVTSLLNLLNMDKEVNELRTGEEGVIVLEITPFYAESGGQIGDSGFIYSQDATFQVLDTQKENDIYFHIGKVMKGKLHKSDAVSCEVDKDKRNLLTYHHSGTHLLNGALRSILGDHVSQRASLVSDTHLRFDFSHSSPMSPTQIDAVEDWVNHSIEKSAEVTIEVLPIEEAKKTGAVAAFDEKYGDMVRIVKMKEYSVEFCGGCHVQNTGDIRYFSIVKESSPGAGNRRIEAVCGEKVVEHYQDLFRNLASQVQEFSKKVQSGNLVGEDFSIGIKIPNPAEVANDFQTKGVAAVKDYRVLKDEIEKVLNEKSLQFIKAQKQIEKKNVANLAESLEEFEKDALLINDITVFKHIFPSKTKVESLKELADRLKNKNAGVLVLFAIQEEKSIVLLYMANQIALQKGIKCNELLKASCEIIGGKGGGKPDMAQGGGKDFAKLEEAIQIALDKLK
ncbi:MAG: alanine--tRNA ligase [Leptospiraceae bacterium]|nr:alanine--tRNA ligase [Leptospiraceae bacterium]